MLVFPNLDILQIICNNNTVTKIGHRYTRPRKLIFEVLEHSLKPVSAKEIFLFLKKRKKQIDLTSIYRTLDLMKKSTIVNEIEFKVDKNDILVLYTDGIIESRNEEGTLFDIRRLTGIVEKNAGIDIDKLREMILKEALDWCKHKQADDMTMIIAKRK